MAPRYYDWSQRRQLLHRVAYWLLMLVGCVAFYLMNRYTGLREEDMFHATIEGTQGQPIDSLLDVLRSWWNHYVDCNGRTANLADYLFNGLLGKGLFNVCNVLVFGALAHLVTRLSAGRDSLAVLAVFFAFVLMAFPLPGETMLWLAGSCNYMWAVTASLAFAAYLLWHRNPRPGWLLGTVVALLSFLAGGSNEGTTMGFAAGLVLYFLFRRDRVDRAVVIAMAGYLLGNVMLLSSPGLWLRTQEVGGDLGATIPLAGHFKLLLTQSVKYVAPAVAVAVCLAALVVPRWRRRLLDTPWPLAFACLLAFVLVLGKAQERPYTAFAVVAFIVMARALVVALDRWRWLAPLAVVLSLALCAYKYPHHLRSIRAFQAHFQAIEQAILREPSRQVILPKSTFTAYTRFMKHFWLDSWNYFIYELPWCIHYDKDNIQFVNDTICNRYNEGRLLDGAVALPFSSTHPADVHAVLMAPDSAYVAIKMAADTVTHTYQFAQAVDHSGSHQQLVFYFPLLYQGQEYYVFPAISDSVATLTFPALGLDREDLTLTRN